MSKVIAHIDMNCFYASVEEKYNPKLKGRPLAVAGEVKKRHGIIVTSNYPARSFGVKTTMRVGEARKLCPSLQIVRPDFEKYQIESKRIFDLVREYTDKIEIVSIDEAYIDLSEIKDPIKVAAVIQRRIYKQLKIPSSIGISYNKFFAKMASDLKKPLGFTIINKKNYKEILWNLDVEKMHGCGKAATKKLKKLKINTIGDVATANEVILHSILGIQGLRLKKRANGEDSRVLKYTVERKSIGNSKTFSSDLIEEEEILKEVKKLSKKVSERAVSRDYVGNNISIMIKFSDFKVMTRSKKISEYINAEKDIFGYAWELLSENYDFNVGIRLLGVSLNEIKKLKDLNIQLDIFDEKNYKKEEKLRKLSRSLKEQFGDKVLTSPQKNDNKNKKTIITTSFSKDFLD
ncbi:MULTISPECIES: DNA polymerase IV [Gemella]|uniref:DNA polymerase IV n=1 Tax=Gemella TaxID=1378 RepID=UPI0007684198|nr:MULTISPECIES: DNA polymerase IV [Gemella]AME09235.1 DNA polymerase IV [Gemella sp. oral taxon 928]AXI26869.1 DNA polymerase IV [Gemella sp. ND 6198]